MNQLMRRFKESDDAMKTHRWKELVKHNPQAMWHFKMLQFHRQAMKHNARNQSNLSGHSRGRRAGNCRPFGPKRPVGPFRHRGLPVRKPCLHYQKPCGRPRPHKPMGSWHQAMRARDFNPEHMKVIHKMWMEFMKQQTVSRDSENDDGHPKYPEQYDTKRKMWQAFMKQQLSSDQIKAWREFRKQKQSTKGTEREGEDKGSESEGEDSCSKHPGEREARRKMWKEFTKQQLSPEQMKAWREFVKQQRMEH